MPRIRSLKPEFFKDDDLCVHPPWVRLLYAGLWIQADREGRLEDRPKKLSAEIFPYDNFDVDKGLAALCQSKKYSPKHEPFIARYEVNGEKYIQIVKFDKHQTPHWTEKESHIPPISKSTPEALQERSGYAQVYPEQGTVSSLLFSLSSLSWEGIVDKDRSAWSKAYPACDIDAELLKMAEWIKANPKKGVKSNWRRFITNWLSRSQDHGGTRGTAKSSKSWEESLGPEWQKPKDGQNGKV